MTKKTVLQAITPQTQFYLQLSGSIFLKDSRHKSIFKIRASTFLYFRPMYLSMRFIKNFFYLSSYLLFGILLTHALQAQDCTGNFGENIFTAGDFGSGTANIIAIDPLIAPGFSYTTAPPPFDGQYVITNNTGVWPNLYPTWLNIGDNSNDPNGYMMVVNASFSPGLFYEQEISDLCENTLYEFSADIINLIRISSDLIDPNISFLIDGVEFYSTGDIPETEQWQSYGFSYTTQAGQNSLTLSLRNNAPGGNGNDLAIDNISFRPCGPEALILPNTIENICEDGEPIVLEATIEGSNYDDPAIQWQISTDMGSTWTDIAGANALTHTHQGLAAGDYYYRYLLANGTTNLMNSKCRIVSNEKIVHVIPKYHHIADTICQGLSFYIGDMAYTSSGSYTDSLISSVGCDSVIHLELTVIDDPNITTNTLINDISCGNGSDGSIELVDIINGSAPYQVRLNDSILPTNFIVNNLSVGTYSLAIEDRYGCSYQEDFELSEPPPFTVNISASDSIVDLGEQLQLSFSHNETLHSFIWQPSILNDCTTNDCLTPFYLPTNNSEVRLVATSINGCIAKDSILIRVNDTRKVYIPNVFSPNGDGVNDRFSINGQMPNVQSVEYLQVFDRWGNMIYEEKDFLITEQDKGWNGQYKGEALPPASFIYVASIRFLDGQSIIYSGDITLLR